MLQNDNVNSTTLNAVLDTILDKMYQNRHL